MAAILLFLALQSPYFQTKAAQYASKELSILLKHEVKIDFVSISWFDNLILKNVIIYDTDGLEMIKVGTLVADFDLRSIFQKNKIKLDDITLIAAYTHINTLSQKTELNMVSFVETIINLTASNDTTPSSKKYTTFSVNKINLQDGIFQFDDYNEPKTNAGFNQFHFGFNEINAEISQFRLIADTFEIKVNGLNCIENSSQMSVCNLNTFFRLTENSIVLSKLDASIGNSYISDSLAFNFQKYGDFNQFLSKVKITASLKDCQIHSTDVAHFAPVLYKYNDLWQITGQAKGTVSDFKISNMDLKFGDNSQILGKTEFTGLPDFYNTFIQLKIKDSYVDVKDLVQYFPSEANTTIRKFKYFEANGKFSGFPTDFVADGFFKSAIGQWDSDVNVKLADEQNETFFEGTLITKDLQLGKILNLPSIGNIDMNGKIEGDNFNLQSAEIFVDAKIDKLGIDNYNYRNITTNAKWSKQQFEGELTVNDSNLVVSAKGTLDLTKDQSHVNISATLDKADLFKLHYSNVTCTASGIANLNFSGLKPDEIVGDINLQAVKILYDNKTLVLDSIVVHSNKEGAQRTFEVNSSAVKLNASGNFEFVNLYTDINTLVHEYYLNYKNNDSIIKRYYSKKESFKSKKYSLDYKVNIKDINPILALFSPDWNIATNTNLSGSFKYGKTTQFFIYSELEHIKYKHYLFKNVIFDLATSKMTDSAAVLSSFNISSSRQFLKEDAISKNSQVNAIWHNNRIDFSINTEQIGYNNSAKLKGNINFLRDNSSEIKLESSELKFLDQPWQIAKDNKIILKQGDITLNNITLTNANQLISFNGKISKNPLETLSLEAENFNINIINSLLSNKLEGIAKGKVDFRNLYNTIEVEGDLNLKELHVDDIYIGDVTMEANWLNDAKILQLNGDINRGRTKIMQVIGHLEPLSTTNQLHLTANFMKTDLKICQPFLNGLVSNISGEAEGVVKISGLYKSPLLNGKILIQKGSFIVDYLNTTYTLNDQVYINESSFTVANLKLKDQYLNSAILSGGIYHNNFKNFKIDLYANLNEFEILNTNVKMNSLYYGKAFATGDLSISGFLDNIAIDGTLKSNAGTKLYIPISSSTTASRSSFINFVKKVQDKTVKDSLLIDHSGIKLNLNFDLNENAYCEIIFDEKSGDIIRGTGHGKLNLQIDTKGDFSMYGKYHIDRGWYNFTFLNVVNKEFIINQNSSITWNGDPYEGQLDVKASIERFTNLSSIIPYTSAKDSILLSKRYPAYVNMGLTGDLMAPQISMGIDIKDTPPEWNTNIVEFKNKMLTNEQELNRQVFSLIVLGRFSSENSFAGGGFVGNSVSELLSNQLSYWVSQVDDELQIDINLNSLDANGLNNLRLKVARNFLNGRLRVTFEDRVASNRTRSSSSAAYAGDWTIEYLLLKSGVLRVKMYNRTTQNVLTNALTTSTNTSAGVSILHTQEFDNILELLHLKAKKKEMEEKNKDENKGQQPVDPKQPEINKDADRPKKLEEEIKIND